MKILITGAGSGIGLAIAKQLALKNHELYIVDQNNQLAEKAKNEIITFSGNHNIYFFGADFSLQVEVKQLINIIRSEMDYIDVLIHNAGAFYDHFKLTSDGFESIFAINHLAGFILTSGLLELVKKSAAGRIIFTSSDLHFKITEIDFKRFTDKKKFNGSRTYATSKLCNILFSYALAEKLKDSSVSVYAHHPGIVRTHFAREHSSLLTALGWEIIKLKGISCTQGAQTGIFLTTEPSIQNKSGLYWYKQKIKRSSPVSYDRVLQNELWQYSEKAADMNFPAV